MFSQGSGVGLSPGTSAHNPPAFSQASQGDKAGAKEGEKSSQAEREPACYVTAVSMMKAMTSKRNNERQ